MRPPQARAQLRRAPNSRPTDLGDGLCICTEEDEKQKPSHQETMSTIPHRGSGARKRQDVGHRRSRLVTSGVSCPLDDTFDGIYHRLEDPSTADDLFKQAMDELFVTLRLRKLDCDEEEWVQQIRSFRQHPLCKLLHEDPFTFRAYSKPRGYAGDAELLDFIYGCEELWPIPDASAVGRRVFNYTTLTPSARGVRARRGVVAALIDRLADETLHPKVLSIAAGHLREASLLGSLKRRTLGRLVALDTDHASLQEVQRSYGRFGVETVQASVRQLLGRKVHLGQFDLVYSTGLFDYLNEKIARQLAAKMFAMVRPGGRMVIANFLAEVRDVGYMEACMDWKLVFRTRPNMIDTTMDIPLSEIADIRLFSEDNQNIIFVQVTRN